MGSGAQRASWILALSALACTTPGPDPTPPSTTIQAPGLQEPDPATEPGPSFHCDCRHVRIATELGVRRYRDDAWGDLDLQPVLGVTDAHQPPDWLLGLDSGVFAFGGDDDLANGQDLDVFGLEGYLGAMKTLHLVPERLLLELGTGLSFTYLFVRDGEPVDADTEDDWSAGAYGRAALLYRLNESVSLGLGLRSVRGSRIELEDVDLGTDYDQLTLTLSIHR